MKVHNPTRQDRLCVQLGENLEAFEVRDVPDGFERCDGCRCVVFDAAVPEPAEADDAAAV